MSDPDYKTLALVLLERTRELTVEHMAMSEVLRAKPSLTVEYHSYLPQATQAAEPGFESLKLAIESGSDYRPALEQLVKLLG
jgi:hypothetical protein